MKHFTVWLKIKDHWEFWFDGYWHNKAAAESYMSKTGIKFSFQVRG